MTSRRKSVIICYVLLVALTAGCLGATSDQPTSESDTAPGPSSTSNGSPTGKPSTPTAQVGMDEQPIDIGASSDEPAMLQSQGNGSQLPLDQRWVASSAARSGAFLVRMNSRGFGDSTSISVVLAGAFLKDGRQLPATSAADGWFMARILYAGDTEILSTDPLYILGLRQAGFSTEEPQWGFRLWSDLDTTGGHTPNSRPVPGPYSKMDVIVLMAYGLPAGANRIAVGGVWQDGYGPAWLGFDVAVERLQTARGAVAAHVLGFASDATMSYHANGARTDTDGRMPDDTFQSTITLRSPIPQVHPIAHAQFNRTITWMGGKASGFSETRFISYDTNEGHWGYSVSGTINVSHSETTRKSGLGMYERHSNGTIREGMIWLNASFSTGEPSSGYDRVQNGTIVQFHALQTGLDVEGATGLKFADLSWQYTPVPLGTVPAWVESRNSQYAAVAPAP